MSMPAMPSTNPAMAFPLFCGNTLPMLTPAKISATMPQINAKGEPSEQEINGNTIDTIPSANAQFAFAACGSLSGIAYG